MEAVPLSPTPSPSPSLWPSAMQSPKYGSEWVVIRDAIIIEEATNQLLTDRRYPLVWKRRSLAVLLASNAVRETSLGQLTSTWTNRDSRSFCKEQKNGTRANSFESDYHGRPSNGRVWVQSQCHYLMEILQLDHQLTVYFLEGGREGGREGVACKVLY